MTQFLIPNIISTLGMSVSDFQGVPSIQEVECSGSGLTPNFDFLSMSLFTVRDDQSIAFVNFASKECSTFVGFSACIIQEKDSHKTHLKSLVLDLNPGQGRRYGCNVTVANARGKTEILQWFLEVVERREYWSVGQPVCLSDRLAVCCVTR